MTEKKTIGVVSTVFDALRRDFYEAIASARGRKIIIFVSYNFHRDIRLLNEVDEHATLWGCDLKVFEDAPTRDPKGGHKNRGLDYYIHIQCVGRS